jgi:ADP-ribose pyrophosphatase YjhB (NUDIX family)
VTRRIDFYDDPAAPEINSVRPAASAFVEHDGTVLLIRRSDNGNWSMPGGAHEPGESLNQTAVRETAEETGIIVRPTGLVGVFTDPRHVTLYTSDGEARQEFSAVYRAEYVAGEPTPSEESTQVEWVPIDRLADTPMDRSQRQRIEWALTQPDGTWIDPIGD